MKRIEWILGHIAADLYLLLPSPINTVFLPYVGVVFHHNYQDFKNMH